MGGVFKIRAIFVCITEPNFKQIMRSLLLLLALSFIASTPLKAQNTYPGEQPKLVVGIVVDQMRYDYLTRYWDRYGEGGFKRLVGQGFNFKNHHFNYVPTATGPGHASVFTGTTPAHHGILGNDYFDALIGERVYCVEDTAYSSVGTADKAGQMSPHRMRHTTLTDELLMFNQYRGKAVAISLKDRGAVLPGGFAGKAYWFHGKEEGKWISSTYYMEELPKWVNKFNSGKSAASYKKDWKPMYTLSSYEHSNQDDTPYERPFFGQESPVFPYKLKQLWKDNGGFDMLKATPFGNSLTTDFALAALEGEDLGKDEFTDMLAISYSSTDYVGHRFGTRAVETEDTYLRLDKDIERLLKALDKKVGEGEYVVFLTADHGASPNPVYVQDHGFEAPARISGHVRKVVSEYAQSRYKAPELIKYADDHVVYLNKEVVNRLGLRRAEVQRELAALLLDIPQVSRAFTGEQLAGGRLSDPLGVMVQNSYTPKLSGDIMLVYYPFVLSQHYQQGGTTHGSPYRYDTHVPFILYGSGIKHGESHEATEIPDIAPTMSALLGISLPSGTTGVVRPEAFK